MTNEEMEAHPAYLLALNRACAAADVVAMDQPDMACREVGFAIGQKLREQVTDAQQRCEASGYSFTAGGRLIPVHNGNGVH